VTPGARRAFGFPVSGPHPAFNELDRQIGTVGELPPQRPPGATRAPGQQPAPPVVAIANGLFIQNGLPLTDGFLQTLASQYGTGARIVDFPSGQGAEQINAWVRQQTAQRITTLFDQLDPATRLVLANAVSLKADWQTPFAKYPTTDATFTRADATTVAVPMVHQQNPCATPAVRGPRRPAVRLRDRAPAHRGTTVHRPLFIGHVANPLPT
jgi:Serpin (serine protease inhibitor)